MDMVVLIDTLDFKLLAESRLIKNQHLKAVINSADLLTRTQKYCSSIEQKCINEYEQARISGFKNGYEESSNQMSQQLARVIAARHVTLTELAPILADIVTDTVKSFLKNADLEQIYSSALVTVNQLIKKAQWVEMRVNPAHLNHAQTAIDTLIANTGFIPVITVIPDAVIEGYDCIFQTDIGTADASLDVQLESIRSIIEASVTEYSMNLDESSLQLGIPKVKKRAKKTTATDKI